MKARPPLTGYNHNVRHGSQLLHVQTEDSGPANPRVLTHLFAGGTVLATKRLVYPADEAVEEVRRRMQEQHKAMLLELRAGQYEAQIALRLGIAPTAAAPLAEVDATIPFELLPSEVEVGPAVERLFVTTPLATSPISSPPVAVPSPGPVTPRSTEAASGLPGATTPERVRDPATPTLVAPGPPAVAPSAVPLPAPADQDRTERRQQPRPAPSPRPSPVAGSPPAIGAPATSPPAVTPPLRPAAPQLGQGEPLKTPLSSPALLHHEVDEGDLDLTQPERIPPPEVMALLESLGDVPSSRPAVSPSLAPSSSPTAPSPSRGPVPSGPLPYAPAPSAARRIPPPPTVRPPQPPRPQAVPAPAERGRSVSVPAPASGASRSGRLDAGGRGAAPPTSRPVLAPPGSLRKGTSPLGSPALAVGGRAGRSERAVPPYGNQPSAEGVMMARPAGTPAPSAAPLPRAQPSARPAPPTTKPVEDLFGNGDAERTLDEVILAFLAEEPTDR